MATLGGRTGSIRFALKRGGGGGVCRIREIIASRQIPADIDATRLGIEATARPLPSGLTGEMVDANGVPCELQTPDGARVIEFLSERFGI